ncbi:MAG: hypothetical protein WCG09_07785 [Halobacteriota archaeon]
MAEVAGSNPAEPTFFSQLDANIMADDEHDEDKKLHNQLHNIDKEAPAQNRDDDVEPSSFLEMSLRDYEQRTGKRRPECSGGRLSPILSPNPTRQLQAPTGLSTVARNPKTWKALPPIFRSRKPI